MAQRFRDDDDDYDDRPRKRRPRDDEDDDVEERISSRRRPSARARNDEDDDAYDRPRKKKAGSKGLIIGLCVGGGVLVLAIVGVVLLLVLRGGGGGDTQKLLVGTWQLQGGPLAAKAIFTADGNLIQDLGLMKLQSKYKVINATTIEIEMNPAAGFGDLFKGLPQPPGGMPPIPQMNIKQTLTIEVTRNDLTITEMGMVKKYKRVN